MADRPYPHIPYGEADIRRIRLRGWLYVDKTRFIRELEERSYVFLVRLRRFGKSLWASVLQSYYDRFSLPGYCPRCRMTRRTCSRLVRA